MGPECQECGEPMISRANKTTGQRFWGCRNYPACRGTRNTDGESRYDRDGGYVRDTIEHSRQRRRWRDEGR